MQFACKKLTYSKQHAEDEGASKIRILMQMHDSPKWIYNCEHLPRNLSEVDSKFCHANITIAMLRDKERRQATKQAQILIWTLQEDTATQNPNIV
jgi:hypothetical protein